MYVPTTSLMETSFQNLLFNTGAFGSAGLLLLPLFLRMSLACLSISACLFLLARRSSTAYSAAGVGGSGGGPVPYTGTTLAGFGGLL